jgi:S1-C subfamily serine protease
MRKLFYFLAVLLLLFAIVQTYHLIPVVRFSSTTPQSEKQTVVYEESVVTKVVEDALPSVVTIGIVKTTTSGGYVEIDPFNFINPFRQVPGTEKKIDQNIGSGFIVSTDGLIITNKHVVSDTEASNKVLTNNNKPVYS